MTIRKSMRHTGPRQPQTRRTELEMTLTTVSGYLLMVLRSLRLFFPANGPIPFGTQFMGEDFGDAGGFDDDDDGTHPAAHDEEQDLLSGSATQSRRARPEAVNYAKRAKRVDVRKLKDNIWKNLDIVVPPTPEDDEMVSRNHRPLSPSAQ